MSGVLQDSRALAKVTHWPGQGGGDRFHNSASALWPNMAVCGNFPATWVAWGAWVPARFWEPGSLRDYGWTGSGDPALSERPVEICLILSGPEPRRMTVVPWDPALSYQTENNTCLLEIYGNMVAWPWPDWRTKALTPRSFQQLTTSTPHHS